MNKKLLAGIIVLICIGGVAAVFGIHKKQQQQAKEATYKTHIDVNLTDEQKAGYEKQVRDTQGKLDASKKQNVPQEEIYNLYLQLGFYKYLLGDLVGARDAYLEASKIAPKTAGVWAGLFPIYRDMTDYDDALDAVKKAVAYNPLDWNMWRNYIEIEQYQFHASNDQLNSLYKQAMDATKSDANILTVYAQFLEETMHDQQSALNLWNIALQQYPTNASYKAEVDRLKKALGQK